MQKFTLTQTNQFLLNATNKCSYVKHWRNLFILDTPFNLSANLQVSNNVSLKKANENTRFSLDYLLSIYRFISVSQQFTQYRTISVLQLFLVLDDYESRLVLE